MVRFCASHSTPIHETLAKAKFSLLNVVKKFKFGAKITLTSISHSFITHLPSNKQTQEKVYLQGIIILPSPYTQDEHCPQCSIKECKCKIRKRMKSNTPLIRSVWIICGQVKSSSNKMNNQSFPSRKINHLLVKRNLLNLRKQTRQPRVKLAAI